MLTSEDERQDFRGQLTDYVRLYAFLAQVLTFADADLEKLYVFARHLRRLLPADRAELPREVQQNIDMESYRIQQTRSGKIALERRPGVLDPVGAKGSPGTSPEEMETLSRIIAELNERFGLNLGPEHRVTLGQMMERLDADAALDASARVHPRAGVERGVGVEPLHHLAQGHPVLGPEIEPEALVQLGDDSRERLHLFRARPRATLRAHGVEHTRSALERNLPAARLLDPVGLHVDVLLHLARQLGPVRGKQPAKVAGE